MFRIIASAMTSRIMKYGVECRHKECVMYRIESGSKKEIQEFSIADRFFAGQGWHHNILENLELLKDQQATINLILP